MRGVEPLLVVAGELPVHLHHLEQLRLYPGTAKFLSEQCNQIADFLKVLATDVVKSSFRPEQFAA